MKRLSGFVVLLALSAAFLAAQVGPLASHVPNPDLERHSPGAAAAADVERPIARVNGVAITGRDLREQMQRLFPYYSMHGGKVPDKYQPEIREKAIQQLIDDELMYQEAKRRNLQVSPATMRDVLRQARQRFETVAAYQAFAKAQYGSVSNFESRVRRAVVIARFQHQEIELKAKVPETQIREIYQKNQKSFLRPESVRLQTISIILPEKPSAEQRELARKRIQEILPQARAARDYNEFGLLAEKVSEDDYRVMMGDRKWVHVVGLPPEIDKSIAGLQPGQISGIVESGQGFTILRVNERRPQKQMEFAEVRDQLRQQLEEGARKERAQSLAQRLRKNARIEML